MTAVIAMAPTMAQTVEADEHIAELVSDNPANYTPDVLDGRVEAIAELGDRIIIGGDFTAVQNAGGGTTFSRDYIAALDSATGVVDTGFAPVLNGPVSAIIPAGDGTSVYVTGNFTTVNGSTEQRVTRIDVATGNEVAGFEPGSIFAEVTDARVVDDLLIIAGRFNSVAGQSRGLIASLDADTGALTNDVTVSFSGTHNGGSSNVRKMEVTPAGDRLLAIGNFTSVDGTFRDQIAMLDLSGPTATLSSWYTDFYQSTCAGVFNTYMRDLDISEDGTYAVISTTGAYFGGINAGVSCDTISRFPVYSSDSNLDATWVTYTGGDTTYAVEIARGVVYAGGHMRWVNNPYAGDAAGPGAIPREGIVALDVVNGMPYSWDPGRSRGVGVFDFLVTDDGLWAGSDTIRWGGETHERFALFPWAGGTEVPANDIGGLPNDVYMLGRSQTGGGVNADDDVRRRYFDEASSTGPTNVVPGTEAWNLARGGFIVNDTVYTGWADGAMYRRSFDGSTWGVRVPVTLFGNTFINDLPTVTGMFFDPVDERIYYTRSGSNTLFWRHFTHESHSVGATPFAAGGDVGALAPNRVQGMFLSGSDLYFADATTGNLLRAGFVDGVVSGPVSTVDDSVDWATRALFAWGGTPAGGENLPPVASFTFGCTDLTCDVDAASSGDVDGTIVAYDWDFGDGTSGSGVTASRTYVAAGTYTVELTVTDDDGATATFAGDVTATDPGTADIAFVGADASNGNVLTGTVTVPGNVQSGDTLVMFVTINRNTTISTPPSGWTQLDSIASTPTDTWSWVFTRTATGADANTDVSVTFASRSKADISLLAYSGTAPVTVVAGTEADTSSNTHTTAQLPITSDGSWVASYWADESSNNTGWTLPANVTERTQTVGTGGGHITAIAGDTGPLTTGIWPGATATSSTNSSKAPTWSVLLSPG